MSSAVRSYAYSEAQARLGASKVAQVTVVFWLAKILTTGIGETTSDYLVYHVNPYLAVVSGAIIFAASLALQFSVRRYVPWIYWTAVLMVSIFGTMTADVTHVVLGVPYVFSAAFYAVLLAAIFITWYRTERTLSIHSIRTVRREIFYWAAILATFALGTATGDMTAMTLHLGYLVSGLFFIAVIALPAIGFWKFGWPEVFSFWFAYVITRPLGASFADWMGKPHSWGGLGWGDGPVSLIGLLLFIGLVVYISRSREASGG